MADEKVAPPVDGYMKPLKGNYLKLVFHHVVSNAIFLCMPPLLALLLPRLSAASLASPQLSPHSAAAGSTLLGLAAALYLLRLPRPVYLVDFACFKGSAAYVGSRVTILAKFTGGGTFTEETVAFQRKMLERSGISDEAYIPASLLCDPPDMCYRTAQEEAETVIFGAVDEVFRNTGVAARDVGVLVTNCSLHNPTPTYADMIVQRYKMSPDVITYNLAGMGCSAGLISIDLVRRLLQVYPNQSFLSITSKSLNNDFVMPCYHFCVTARDWTSTVHRNPQSVPINYSIHEMHS